MVVIFIINWNGIEDTLECLESLQKSNFSDFFVYLLDNNSSDQSWDILQKRYGSINNIKLFQSQNNLGFTGGNNYLFEILKDSGLQPQYLILLNNDTVVKEEWLGNLVSFAENSRADMVSSKMIQYFKRNNLDNAGHFLFITGEIWPIGYNKNINRFNHPFENKGPCAGAGLYRWSMIQKIGLFDSYFSTGYEDAELGLRAIQLGYFALYCPNALVYHKGGQSLKKIDQNLWKADTQKNILYTYFKIMPIWYILTTAPFVCLKFIATWILSIWNKNYRIYNSGLYLFLKDWRKAMEARRSFTSLKNVLQQTFPD